MKLYDGGAAILLIIALVAVIWNVNNKPKETSVVTPEVIIEQPVTNPFSWFGRGN